MIDQKDHIVTDAESRRSLHESIDRIAARGRYDHIDWLLRQSNCNRGSVGKIVTLLTATKLYAVHLKDRNAFFERARKAIIKRGLMEPGLLEGLE